MFAGQRIRFINVQYNSVFHLERSTSMLEMRESIYYKSARAIARMCTPGVYPTDNDARGVCSRNEIDKIILLRTGKKLDFYMGGPML